MNSQRVPTDKHGVQCSALHKRRVLFVITKSVWGGAQRYVFDLAANLPSEQFEIAVALGGDGPLKTKLIEKNITVYTVAGFQRSINLIKDMQVFFELVTIYRHFHPHIIHANSSKAGGIASVAAFFYNLASSRKTTRVFTAHGWAFLEMWRPAWQRYLIRIASRLTALLHTHVIVMSSADKRAAYQYNMAPKEKVTKIYNGINPPVATSFLPRDRAQQELLGDRHKLVIGTIAEFTKNKGLIYLIEAMPMILKKIPDAKLCLVGWGEESAKLKAESEKLGIGKNVFYVSRSPAAPYLKAFDIFVLPSLKEGLPYALLEAGLAELPVVSTRVGGVPDILEHNKNGLLVDTASPSQLADALICLAQNPHMRERMGHENKKRVESAFSLSEMVRKTIAVYRHNLYLLPAPQKNGCNREHTAED